MPPSTRSTRNDRWPPEDAFTALPAQVFGTAGAEVVTFDNPLQGRTATNTVYLARP